MVLYLCLNFKPLKIVLNFHAKICDLVKNYVHYGKTHLCIEAGDDYIFVKVFVKKALTINPIIFYGALLSRCKVEDR